MTDTADAILSCLREVAAQRERRAAEPALAARVAAVKQFQHSRFSHTYADLLADKRYANAAAFFLEDLYGPTDFSERDRQFVRVVPSLVRIFPPDIVATVRDLATLHALSERLDSEMAVASTNAELDAQSYGQAWRKVGQPEARDEQIALMLSIGNALDRYTRRAMLRHSLRLMRGPARAAGLGALQRFLEAGFDTFKSLGGAGEFLAIIEKRERALAAALFAGDDGIPASPASDAGQ